jgi:hypothetical protein
VVSRSLATALCAGAIVALALALRLWHLHFGLPEWYHPDEVRKARAIARIAAGDLHPGSFYHPSFLLYASALTLRLQHPDGAGIDEQSAVRAGRLTVALLGTATVGMMIIAGGQLAGTVGAMAAGLLLAVAPLHVVCSHYLKEDVPLAFWMVATWIASVRIITRGAARDVTTAALLAGVAAGTKYPGVLCVALVWAARRMSGVNAWRRIGLAAASGFLLTTPFALLDPVGFVRGLGHDGASALTGMAGISVWPISHLWTYHLRHSLVPGFGVLPIIAALAGIGIAIARGGSLNRLLLATVAVLYLIFETSPYKPPPNAERHVVPLLPFMALLAATALQSGAARLADRRVAAALLAIVAVGPLYASARLTAAMQPDTRAAAADWLRANACGRQRIVLEGALNAGGALVPNYVPQLPAGCDATYVYSLERDRAALEDAALAVASSFTYERYLHLLSPEAPPRRFYESLFASHELVAEFVPAYESYGFHNPTIRVYALVGTGAVMSSPIRPSLSLLGAD